MDANNLQHQQSSASGSEFALRVALSDLVHRLKRSVDQCKYLEQCRNELANEVIKLQSHNNLLVRELTNVCNENNRQLASKANIYNTQSQTICSSNNELDNRVTEQLDYKKSVKLDSIVDESWEEITNRLINQLKKEILVAESEAEQHQRSDSEQHEQTHDRNEHLHEKKPTSTLCSSGSNYFDLKSADQTADNLAVNEYETQEQHMAINDLADVKASDDKEHEKESMSEDQTRTDSSTVVNQAGIMDDGLFYKLLENCTLRNHTNSKTKEAYENKDQIKSNILDIIENFFNKQSDSLDTKRTEQVDLVEKLLRTFNMDLEEITSQIMIQNEKLIKLKGKQIRNYFRRQLDINNRNPSSVPTAMMNSNIDLPKTIIKDL